MTERIGQTAKAAGRRAAVSTETAGQIQGAEGAPDSVSALTGAGSASALQVAGRLKQARLSDQVYDHVFRKIASGQLAAGDRLPTESNLCELFNVSRPVIREAMARLRAERLISSLQGSGSYVERGPGDFLRFARPSGEMIDLLHCFEFRFRLEGESASFAAEHRTAANLRSIKSTLDGLAGQNGKIGPAQKADLAFHMAIAEGSGNYFFVRALQLVERYIQFGTRLARRISITPGSQPHLVQEEHALIYEAVRDRDGQAAQAAMQSHIANERARVLTAASRSQPHQDKPRRTTTPSSRERGERLKFHRPSGVKPPPNV